MQRGVPVWEAAGFLGMSAEVLLSTYGHHHPDLLREATNAITSKHRVSVVIADCKSEFRAIFHRNHHNQRSWYPLSSGHALSGWFSQTKPIPRQIGQSESILPHTNARPLLQRSQVYRAPTTATLGG
jgi:hypothetical protein